MKGVTIVETEVLENLVHNVTEMHNLFKSTVIALKDELKEAKKPWMTSKEVCEYLGKGSTWVDMNKEEIGFAKAGGEIRFRRKDVEAYLESRYFRKGQQKSRVL